MSEVYYSSIFSELTKQVQARIDAASELRKRLFDQNVYERFGWDTPTVGFNFEEIIGSYNLSVAAATLDSKGKEPIMGTEGLATIAKKVLIHQMTLPMPIEDYRKVLQLLDSRMISDQAKKQQLVNLMWGGVERVVESVQAKIDIIFLGALSNKGVFSFTQKTTPKEVCEAISTMACRKKTSPQQIHSGRRATSTRSMYSRISKALSMQLRRR